MPALEGYEPLPETARAGLEGLRPEMQALPMVLPAKPITPPKSEGGKRLEVVSPYEPKGDQPTAIKELVAGINGNERNQVLLGVTGSGKTIGSACISGRRPSNPARAVSGSGS